VVTNGRKKVGLALGGGVVRGLAHAGVLTALVEEGIPVDMVAAASAGSFIGASFCSGASPQDIRQHGSTLRWWNLAGPSLPWRGLVTFDPMRRWLIKTLGDVRLEDLPIPMAVAVTDLETGAPVYLFQGPLAEAVQASCSIPGLVTPVRIGERWLGDGSVSDSVPVDILRQMGAEYVIGVDIFTVSPRLYLGPLGVLLTTLEILVEHAGGGIGRADCLISPALAGKTYFRFSKREELFALGEQAAREKLPEIRAAVFG
jgi:NTE family protein